MLHFNVIVLHKSMERNALSMGTVSWCKTYDFWHWVQKSRKLIPARMLDACWSRNVLSPCIPSFITNWDSSPILASRNSWCSTSWQCLGLEYITELKINVNVSPAIVVTSRLCSNIPLFIDFFTVNFNVFHGNPPNCKQRGRCSCNSCFEQTPDISFRKVLTSVESW